MDIYRLSTNKDMRQKERIIAIDYFRGICILMVVVDHLGLSSAFTNLAGGGRLWTSAAEMFFLLSGITLSIVRGRKIVDDFVATTKKFWRRALNLYIIDIAIVLASLLLSLSYITHGSVNPIPQALPHGAASHLMVNILTFNYSYGWANFLMYYSVFMLVAPFTLRALYGRAWPAVPVLASLLYAAGSYGYIHLGAYQDFLTWQFYFFVGLVLGRFRLEILGRYYALPSLSKKLVSSAILLCASVATLMAALFEFNLQPKLAHLTDLGLLPAKIPHAYSNLLAHKPLLDRIFADGRFGIGRPLVALVCMSALYLIYQANKRWLLPLTGDFVNAMGRDTLWIFVAQALAIPWVVALPIPHTFINDTALTAMLIGLMWLITQRRMFKHLAMEWLIQLRASAATFDYTLSYIAESGLYRNLVSLLKKELLLSDLFVDK